MSPCMQQTPHLHQWRQQHLDDHCAKCSQEARRENINSSMCTNRQAGREAVSDAAVLTGAQCHAPAAASTVEQQHTVRLALPASATHVGVNARALQLPTGSPAFLNFCAEYASDSPSVNTSVGGISHSCTAHCVHTRTKRATCSQLRAYSAKLASFLGVREGQHNPGMKQPNTPPNQHLNTCGLRRHMHLSQMLLCFPQDPLTTQQH